MAAGTRDARAHVKPAQARDDGLLRVPVVEWPTASRDDGLLRGPIVERPTANRDVAREETDQDPLILNE